MSQSRIMLRASCGACAFWDTDGHRPDEGWCRRYPPRLTPSGQGTPLTLRASFCGEYVDRNEFIDTRPLAPSQALPSVPWRRRP